MLDDKISMATGRALNTAKKPLIVFERLNRTPLPPLISLFRGLGYLAFAVDGGCPTMEVNAAERAHDLFACRAKQ